MEDLALRFDNIGKVYPDGTRAVSGFTLDIRRGEFIVLIGPSGCGKTTTLRVINRLIEPSSGTIFIDGRDFRQIRPVELRRRLGYVIQRIGLMPHLTIQDNITFVPRLNRVPAAARRTRATELLEMVGLDPAQYLDRYPAELSGGQQQRIGVLRALAHDPDIILMDEPFGALDPLMRDQLQDELKKLQRTVAKTIIFVTHDMDEALTMADRIVLMKEGEIVQVGTPEEMLRHPKDAFVSQFIGRHRMLRQASEVAVGEVMLKNPVTGSHSMGIAQSLELMRRRRVDSILVTDSEGRLLGVLGLAQVQSAITEDRRCTAEELAAKEPALSPQDPVLEAMHRMLAEQRSSVPVVDDQGRAIGLVTQGTLAGLLGDALKVAHEAEPEPTPRSLHKLA
ncbi:ABC transporter ATP-binding protein [Sulfobacillus harzensis]|uniref:Quaternary amine transport ATP-binding protein n=1 Tax=Sulfobacillus harzensis TaxID=2729629 RepID=A0A7Y0L140_9FIRM|nr:ABC transporter ATP-binding protein [Sulfobacillus harzensis]NMP21359.1 betaine/proline/choline family ABC transporter ATP-binding protein [Sulfobacillus harzensis]